jgi:hypothetical protein
MASLERRWSKERDRHEDQVQPWRFFAGRGQRRSATLTPGPLRYWSYAPPRLWLLALAVVVVAGFIGFQFFVDDTPAASSDVVRYLAVVALVLIVSTTRITVSNTGLSFDIAGPRRVSCFGFIPLSAILDVAVGTRPADWPAGRSASSWFPGSHAVRILHLMDGERMVRSLWVRDPDRFGTAVLGRPPRDQYG